MPAEEAETQQLLQLLHNEIETAHDAGNREGLKEALRALRASNNDRPDHGEKAKRRRKRADEERLPASAPARAPARAPASAPAGFVHVLARLDESYCAHFTSARNAEMKASAAVRRPPAAPFLLSSGEDALFACTDAIGRVAVVEAPAFTTESDPKEIYRWTWQTMLKFGDSEFERGRQRERGNVGLPLDAEQAQQAFRLMTCLETLLTNSRAATGRGLTPR